MPIKDRKAVSPAIPPLDTPSGWHTVEELVPLSNASAIPRKVEWLVIGGGITGIAAAARLGARVPHDRVLLVDARPIGWGASGRNSGFLLDLPHKFDLDTRDRTRLNKIMGLNRMAIDDLKENVIRFEIACDWAEVGKLHGAVSKRGEAMLKKYTEALEWLGVPYDLLDRDASAAIMGTSYYSTSAFTPGTVLIDPVYLVRGLAKHLPENVTLLDDTPVVNFARDGAGFSARLRSKTGEEFTISAKKVILATDPYTGQFGYMKSQIAPSITFASITRPLTTEERLRYSGQFNWGLTPADAAGTTLRMTVDGRLLIRNHYAAAPNFQADDQDLNYARRAHRKGIDKRWPALANIPIAATWGGVVSLSGNHQTFFGNIDENIYSSNCYNGVGMTRGWMAGKLLADFATGHRSQSLDDIVAVSGRPNRLPPEPLLSTGVNARLRLAKWQSSAEV